MSRLGKHAIVLGGSIGGIVAARVLADHFEQVIVFERDKIPGLGVPRKGVPQGRQAHGLLYGGYAALETLFPGWSELVVREGGIRGEPGRDGLWIHHGHVQAKVDAPINGLLASRPLLEGTLRNCLVDRPNVRFAEDTDVLGITTSPDRSRISGARVRERSSGLERTFSADLVIDALGRGSPSPRWLAELEYAPPECEEVRINQYYTSRVFRRPAHGFEGNLFIIVAAVPGNPRSAAMLALEGDRFIVALTACFGERVPEDLEGFRAYAESLPSPEVGRFVRHAEPLDEPRTHPFPASRRLRYEALRAFPAGYLVFGDALASFNPVFGQGITVAALEGLLLGECLEQGTGRLARRFFKAASRVIDIPWSTAVLNDLRFPNVEGKRSPMVRFLHGYLPRLYERGTHDTVIARTVLDVVNLGKSPSALLSPRMLWHVYGPRRGRPQPAFAAGSAIAERRA